MDTVPKPVILTGDAELPAGHLVGEYVVEAKIGEGGFGTVFRAAHPLIGKQVAIKVLSRKYSVDPEMLSRFVSEARAVNQIRHRNIIDIFAFGHLEDGRSYFVMELLDGEPLDKLIEHNGGLPLTDALAILRPIARALDAAHAKGIAHRDLKPENIYLSRDPDGTAYPKLLDFGIAKLLGDAGARTKHRTRTGAPLGTPLYMSPEQCRGEAVDTRTDIYTFGCVAYQLITGVVPFDGTNDMAIMLKHCSNEPVPASEQVKLDTSLPPLPDGVDAVLARLMKKEPAERPPNLVSAIQELERACGIDVTTDPSLAALSLRTPSVVRPVRFEQQPTVGLADTQMPAVVLPTTPRAKWPVALATIAALGVCATIWWIATRGPEKSAPPPVAAQPAPPPPAAKPAPPPPAPTTVKLAISGVPDGTEVSGPNGPLGTAPGELVLPRGDHEIVLTLAADGYVTKATHVTPSRDLILQLALEQEPAVVAEKPQKKRPPKKKKPETKVVPTPTTGSNDPFQRK